MSENTISIDTKSPPDFHLEQGSVDDQREHPIHQCPIEIVQEIFELAVDDPYEGETEHHSLRAATLLSQISQSWRFIALDTPRLWAHAWVHLGKPKDAIEEYWERTLERVKGATISIQVVIPRESTMSLLPTRFGDVQKIGTLQMDFATPNEMEMLVSDEFPLPHGHIDKLVLKTSNNYLQDSWSLSKLMKKWPQISTVTLKNFNTVVELEPEVPFTHIDTFEAFLTCPPTLKALAETLPNLQSLGFQGVKNMTDEEEVITFKSLNRLTFRRWLYKDTLRCMSCPNLTALGLEQFSSIGFKVLDFIQSHKTIVSLELWHSIPDLRELAEAAPQLKKLILGRFEQIDILYDWESKGLSSPPFPFLNSLQFDERNHILPLDKFDALVRRRGLSSTHSESLLPPEVQGRIRSMKSYYESEPEWPKSDLLQYAKQTVYYRRRWGIGMTKIMFEWP